jgi:proteasome lid subunit RPN8/RPN11
MTVGLPAGGTEAIRKHGRETYPHECCGFLVGSLAEGRRIVSRLLPAENQRVDSPANRYLIPPEQFLKVERSANADGLEIVGFYHSHPDAPPRPSEFDRAHAWPGYAYLIVSMGPQEAGELLAWELSEDRVWFRACPLEEEA